MLGNPPIVAFVVTTDRDRAKRFYGETLGLRFVTEDDHALVFDAHGTSIRMTVLPGHKPVEYTVLGWNVSDIRTAAAALERAGVSLERYSFLEQDEQGIWTAPGGAAKVG